MSILKKNIISNYLGVIFITLVQITSLPVIFNLLGKSAFGLVGFFTTLQAVFNVFDLGLSATFSREIARCFQKKQYEQYSMNLFKTFERLYWGIALILGLIIVALSPILSKHYLHDDILTSQEKISAIAMMGVLFTFRWPISIYSGGLIGIQRQVIFNKINTSIEIAKILLCILVLKYISSNVISYFLVQIVLTVLSVVIFSSNLRKFLKISHLKSKFDWHIIFNLKSFLFGMSGISLLSVLLSQIDKIILLNYVLVSVFAYYSFAFSISSAISKFSTPLGQAFYPKYIQLIEDKCDSDLNNLFHTASQLISFIIIPISLIICFFSYDLIWVYSHHNFELTQNVYKILSILIIGNMANTLCSTPYLLQIAHGWTKLTITQNLILAIIGIPILTIIARIYGNLGAAWFWASVNLLTLIVSVGFMFQRILKHQRFNFFFYDIFLPLVSSLTIVIFLKILYFKINIINDIGICLFLVFSTLLSMFTTLMSCNKLRKYLLDNIKKLIYAK